MKQLLSIAALCIFLASCSKDCRTFKIATKQVCTSRTDGSYLWQSYNVDTRSDCTGLTNAEVDKLEDYYTSVVFINHPDCTITIASTFTEVNP